MRSPGAPVILCLVLAAGPPAAEAPTRPKSEPIVERVAARVAVLKERLALTDGQAVSVEAILVGSAEERAALLEQRGVDDPADLGRFERQAWAREMAAIRERTDRRLAAVLNASQMERFKKLREEAMRRRSDR